MLPDSSKPVSDKTRTVHVLENGYRRMNKKKNFQSHPIIIIEKENQNMKSTKIIMNGKKQLRNIGNK